jgi:hypothetical protein
MPGIHRAGNLNEILKLCSVGFRGDYHLRGSAGTLTWPSATTSKKRWCVGSNILCTLLVGSSVVNTEARSNHCFNDATTIRRQC